MNKKQQNRGLTTRVNFDFDEETNKILREISEKTGLKLVAIVSRALRLAQQKVEKGEIL